MTRPRRPSPERYRELRIAGAAVSAALVYSGHNPTLFDRTEKRLEEMYGLHVPPSPEELVPFREQVDRALASSGLSAEERQFARAVADGQPDGVALKDAGLCQRATGESLVAQALAKELLAKPAVAALLQRLLIDGDSPDSGNPDEPEENPFNFDWRD